MDKRDSVRMIELLEAILKEVKTKEVSVVNHEPIYYDDQGAVVIPRTTKIVPQAKPGRPKKEQK